MTLFVDRGRPAKRDVFRRLRQEGSADELGQHGVSVVLERKIALRFISSLVNGLRRRFQAIWAISPLFVSRNCASLSGPNSENMGFCIVGLLDHAETTMAKTRFGAEN